MQVQNGVLEQTEHNQSEGQWPLIVPKCLMKHYFSEVRKQETVRIKYFSHAFPELL